MTKIDLRSDTVTKPSREMREYMMAAEVGDDVFSEDPAINQLQQKIAVMTGKEAALFVPSGTQANQVSINAHTIPGTEVICDYQSHIFNYESGAAGLLAGVQLHPLPGKNGHPTAAQVAEAIRPFDDHYPQSSLVCLENTHNKAGGTIFSLKQIAEIDEFVRSRHLKLHLDGARLWNASIATGISISEYASYFDSVSLCFSKGLGAPVGSIVAGSKEFIKRAHYYRKAYGGGMRQAGILAAACEFAVDNNFLRLAEDHQKARMLAEGLNSLSRVEIDLDTVETNILIFDISKTGKEAPQVCNEMEQAGILSIPFSSTRIRLVTHLDVSLEEVGRAIEILKKLFR